MALTLEEANRIRAMNHRALIPGQQLLREAKWT